MDLLKNYLLTETLNRESKAAIKKPKVMTSEEFAAKMREAYETHYVKEDDEEVVHGVMDSIMCDLLRQLGYGEGIDIFDNTPKWYS